MLVRRELVRAASLGVRAAGTAAGSSRTARLFEKVADGGSVTDIDGDALKEMYKYESMDVYVRDRMRPDTTPDDVGSTFERLNRRAPQWMTLGSKLSTPYAGNLEDAWKAPAADPILEDPSRWSRDMLTGHVAPPTPKPSSITTVTVDDLLRANVHLGHSKSVWNPRMAPYIHSVRNKYHIIDVHQTLVHLRRAMNVVREVAAMNGIIVFVALRPQLHDVVKMLALHCDQYFVYQRWTPGTITNPRRVLKVDVYQPDLMVFLDPLNSPVAVTEANSSDIPTMGICDTNMDPTKLTYPIPGNDDGLESILLLGSQLSNAALEGRERFKRSFQGRAEAEKREGSLTA